MVVGTGIDTIIGSLVTGGVAIALWILRGIRQDVQAIIRQQRTQGDALGNLRVQLVGDYVKRAEHETTIKGLYEHIDAGRKDTDDRLDGINTQITEIKVSLAKNGRRI